jgi:hypothetical protein
METTPPHLRKHPVEHLTTVVIECTIFIVLGALLGFFISFMFPDLYFSEPLWHSIGWFLLQLIVDSIILAMLDLAYLDLFGRNASAFIGMNMFSIVFFITQVQLFNRATRIYRIVTGSSLVRAT